MRVESCRRIGFGKSTIYRMVRAVLLTVAACVLFLPASQAQTTSTIQGTVTDKQGLAISGALLQLSGDTIGTNRTAVSDSAGGYQFQNLPAGVYKLTVTHAGFATNAFKELDVTINRTLTFNLQLEVGRVDEVVNVSAEPPLLETNSSSTGSTILPQDINNMPINGRNYLDLLQLVPGVAIYRQSDANSDNTTPILGERANNTGYLIDGQPNENALAGGASAQFNQDTIAEFQVITSGYKAEFGHSSGGVVNVITKSGGNDLHGLASVYNRNSAFDSSDIPGQSAATTIPGQSEPPYLLRWDYDVAAGGAMVRDKAFWFASAENIHENQQLNFVPPPNTPQFLLNGEETYNQPTTNNETRVFGKFDQNLGRHHLTEEMNYTNTHVNSTNPLSLSTSLPSTRTNLGDRNLLLGFSDTFTFGDSGSPFILNLRGQYRGESTLTSAAHPQAGPNTRFNIFSNFTTDTLFGDLGTVTYGATFTPSNIDQKYGIFGANLAKTLGRVTLKFGWDFERTQVDGVEADTQQDQLFATESDYLQFGPIDSGFFLLATTGGLTPQANDIKLRNNYNGLWVQGDWKITRTLTANLGVRWDYDSEFNKKDNFSPRIGFAWSVNPKTVVRGSFGYFYDHFRLGLARDVPGFGGANIELSQPLSFPRLFYGVPTWAPSLFGLCASTSETDAQLASQPGFCIPPGGLGPTFPGEPAQYGIDHLNKVVAAGNAPIPANAVVNLGNVQQLSGLTPDAFLTGADAAIGMPSGFWFWGPFGALSFNVNQPGNYPVSIAPGFATPYTRSETLGIQHQFGNDWVVSLDYYHKDIDNLLGVRETNIPFGDRITNMPSIPTPINGYGPWYRGTYNAGILSFEKRISKRYAFGGSYALVNESDDALNSNLGTSSLSASSGSYPTDSFVGIPPVVTDPGTTNPVTGQVLCPSKTNAKAAFTACNGNYVPKAGVFYNGPALDSGPSDLALRNTFEIHGLVNLPWGIQLSSLFRAQSGFPYTQIAAAPIDQDGNGSFGGRDLQTGRNAFNAPAYVNMDLRIAKTWVIRERVQVQGLFEFFNLFNNANAAAIQTQQGLVNSSNVPTFGTISEWLPGRQGQIGLKIQF
jgi:hypothetical protein